MSTMDYLEIVLTLVVGFVLIIVLLICYIYVFHQMCCKREPNKDSTRINCPRESISLRYVTHISSQPTETEVL